MINNVLMCTFTITIAKFRLITRINQVLKIQSCYHNHTLLINDKIIKFEANKALGFPEDIVTFKNNLSADAIVNLIDLKTLKHPHITVNFTKAQLDSQLFTYIKLNNNNKSNNLRNSQSKTRQKYLNTIILSYKEKNIIIAYTNYFIPYTIILFSQNLSNKSLHDIVFLQIN
ncbi:hypothetical protein AGLY_007943 [Aphis glycines]|uniref:Uncharacterized protein n=1 Tax=Aphis glycines TaxID=307491 RepID=A0A6G0TLY3_APHGL|nr:hypothetical protein AGLY_007943 [Aphis glycines]